MQLIVDKTKIICQGTASQIKEYTLHGVVMQRTDLGKEIQGFEGKSSKRLVGSTTAVKLTQSMCACISVVILMKKGLFTFEGAPLQGEVNDSYFQEYLF